VRDSVLIARSTDLGVADRSAEDAGGGRFAVARLDLTNFRSYPRLRLEVEGSPVVLVGPNGAGKTNLLEALSFLVPGRGLRRARLADVAFMAPNRGRQEGPSGGVAWGVAAAMTSPSGEVEIGTGLELVALAGQETGPERFAERRAVRINGARAQSQSALSEYVSAVWLTPQMDRLFLDSPGGRRRFLDRLVETLDDGHAARVGAYENALRQRHKILREARESGRRADGDWLAALEEAMAANGVAVAAARIESARRLTETCARSTSAFPAARLAVAGLLEEWLAEMPALGAEERFRDALCESRSRDAEMGTTGEGPHRSDLAVEHVPKGLPALQCSTGEQKALLVAIVLANARLRAADQRVAPLLLLDEVAAHLDRKRLGALFEEIVTLGAQAWLTGTDVAAFDGLRSAAQFYGVRESIVTPDDGSRQRG
jgi:DNA replication and repair protein RecF